MDISEFTKHSSTQEKSECIEKQEWFLLHLQYTSSLFKTNGSVGVQP